MISKADKWLDAVIRLRRPLDPIATQIAPAISKLSGIRAVVFDVYGTLLISGSGDVGSADASDTGSAIRDAFAAVGWLAEARQLPTIEQLHRQIKISNDERITANCPKPEVDIIEIWRQTLVACGLQQMADDIPRLVTFAAEYEARANPTWPMPGAKELVSRIAATNLSIGIVSNAQAFTIPLMEDFSAESHTGKGFDLDLCIYSYRYRHAKPGPRLFDALRNGLRRCDISPHEAVYVGNDMLNDIWAASAAGFRTAWFAGDLRSCRARDDDPRCRSFQPDVVLTNLLQLLDCLEIK